MTTNIYVIKDLKRKQLEIKVGKTDRSWEEREREYKTSGIKPKLLYMEYGVDFSDDKIKEILLNNLHYKIADEGDEWYLLQNGESEKDFVNKVKAIIVSLKNNTPLNINRYNDFPMREEQKECVDRTAEAFKTNNSFLWNCKMRFGKTFTAYQLIKQLNIKNSLILTWKVAVESSWREDLESHIDFKDYSFVNKEHLNNIDKNKNNVVFLSIPLLLANKTKDAELEEDNENSEDKEISEENIQKFKEKIKSIIEINWDLLIIDEAHYGTRAKNTAKLLTHLHYKKKLELSGTPFKILNDNEYSQKQIYNWTYRDEQRKKQQYKYLGDKNPYKDLPDMKIYTYDGAKTLVNQEKITWDDDFNINYIFETTKNDRGEDVFTNKTSVERIVDFMCGEQFDLSEDRNVKEYKVVLPFFQDMVEKNKKSLWFLPNVSSVCALENLLKNHKIFKDYSIINATGRGEGSSVKSLEKFNQEIKQGRDKIICLSCGMLNTGITIKQLNSVVVLQNKKSAQDFFQSIFRCQTPDKDSNKTECYVFDFNPRHYFENLKKFIDSNGGNVEKEYINENIIDTILYYDGNVKQVDYETMESYISWDISPDKIKRFFLKANNINLDLLVALNDNQQDIIDIIDKIPMYRNEKQQKETKERLPKHEKDKWEELEKMVKNNKQLKIRLNNCKKQDTKLNSLIKDIKHQKTVVNNRRKEKTKFDIRKTKIDILIGSLTIFIYITNTGEKNLKDVINTTEKELFEKICFISVDEFNKLYENKLFKEQVLDKAIHGFYNQELMSRDWSEIIRERVCEKSA